MRVCVLESQMESLKGRMTVVHHTLGALTSVYMSVFKFLLFDRQGVCGFNLASGFHHSHTFI